MDRSRTKTESQSFTPCFLGVSGMVLMWREAKRKKDFWNHIQINLSGEDDFCICKICGKKKLLTNPERTRISLLLETARIHFYRHKLGEKV